MGRLAVFLSVRNRLAITKRCIEYLFKNTRREIDLFVFDNCTGTRIPDHFNYFCRLYEQGKLQKYVANTITSTYNAFSKAMSFNEFGLFIENHPDKFSYDWLVCLDNDMILIQEKWDDIIGTMFEEVDKKEPNNTIQIITQYPGGCSGTDYNLDKFKIRVGVNSGSGFWNIRPDFFTKVGLLESEPLIGINKRHDLELWPKLNAYTKGQPYVIAIDQPMALHIAYHDGKDLSICKATRNNPAMNVDFELFDNLIETMNDTEFNEFIMKDADVSRRW